MRTEIINIIKCLTTKGQPCLDELLKKLDDLYCKTDMNDKDRRFVKRILGIFYPDIHFVSKSKVPLDEGKVEPSPKETELMTLQEASETMKTGDTFKIENDGARLELYEKPDEQICYFKSWATSKDIILSPTHFKMRGTIIPSDTKISPFATDPEFVTDEHKEKEIKWLTELLLNMDGVVSVSGCFPKEHIGRSIFKVLTEPTDFDPTLLVQLKEFGKKYGRKFEIEFKGKDKNGTLEFEITFNMPLAQIGEPEENSPQITKKEYYHIQIGYEDFGDFRVESEWECLKSLKNDHSGLSALIMEGGDGNFSIIKASPVIMMALKGNTRKYSNYSIDGKTRTVKVSSHIPEINKLY